MKTFQSAPGGRLIGYKVMGYDPKTREVVSGANKRLRLSLTKGSEHRMPSPGIFLGSTRQYVLDYYAVFDVNALITYTFSPEDVTSGSLTDTEPEITVSRARVERFEVFDEDHQPIKLATALDRLVAKFAAKLQLADYGLEGMTTGTPVTLYHGTTRTFRAFDLSKTRDDLVDAYYGRGIFLTPSKRVADKYAEANRNIGFDVSIIGDLKRKNPGAGNFLQNLYDNGDDAWDIEIAAAGIIPDGNRDVMGDLQDRFGGVDGNTLGNIAGYIIGSKVKPLGGGDGPLNLFSMSTGAPDWLYEDLDTVGLDSAQYRPKRYTVSVTVHNPLVTSNKSQARNARTKGYDSVVYFGSGLVDGVPEVAVYDPHHVKIQHVEVL